MRVLSSQNIRFTLGPCSQCGGSGTRKSDGLLKLCLWCRHSGKVWGTRVDGKWMEYAMWLHKYGDKS